MANGPDIDKIKKQLASAMQAQKNTSGPRTDRHQLPKPGKVNTAGPANGGHRLPTPGKANTASRPDPRPAPSRSTVKKSY